MIAAGVEATRRDSGGRGIRVTATIELRPGGADAAAGRVLGGASPTCRFRSIGDNRLRRPAARRLRSGGAQRSGRLAGARGRILAQNQFLLAGAPSLLAREPDLSRQTWLLSPAFPESSPGCAPPATIPRRCGSSISKRRAGLSPARSTAMGWCSAPTRWCATTLPPGGWRSVDFPGLPKISYWAVTAAGAAAARGAGFIDWLKYAGRRLTRRRSPSPPAFRDSVCRCHPGSGRYRTADGRPAPRAGDCQATAPKPFIAHGRKPGATGLAPCGPRSVMCMMVLPCR